MRFEPPVLVPEIFAMTMRGLESGLTVGDIATYGLVSCDEDDVAAEVLGRADLAQFDCVPVRKSAFITGVLLRDAGSAVDGTVGEAMVKLHEGLLVAADEPLKRFLPLLVEMPFRLVVRGATVEGIATASDVLKLPVRLLAFALVTHLEMTMADVIVQRYSGQGWESLLTEGRRKKLAEKFDALKTANFDPALIEVADFCDKRDVLLKAGVLTSHTTKREAKADFKAIEQKLRNILAHGATYVHNQGELEEFVRLLGVTEAWIQRLQGDPMTSAGRLAAGSPRSRK